VKYRKKAMAEVETTTAVTETKVLDKIESEADSATGSSNFENSISSFISMRESGKYQLCFFVFLLICIC